MSQITLQDVKAGEIIKLTRYGGKYTVESRREPEGGLHGYIALRSERGKLHVIGSRHWDMPITVVPAARARRGGARKERDDDSH